MAPLFAIDPWKLDNKQLSDENSHIGSFCPGSLLASMQNLRPASLFSLYLQPVFKNNLCCRLCFIEYNLTY